MLIKATIDIDELDAVSLSKLIYDNAKVGFFILRSGIVFLEEKY